MTRIRIGSCCNRRPGERNCTSLRAISPDTAFSCLINARLQTVFPALPANAGHNQVPIDCWRLLFNTACNGRASRPENSV